LASITVSTSSELNAALKAASAGDTIYLESGVYSGVVARNILIDGNVTITSKDPGDPAVLTGLSVSGSSGMTFEHLELSPPEGGYFAYIVSGSSNITFSKLDVHGSLNDNPQGDSSGISIRNSSDIRVEDSEFYQLRRGVAVNGSDGVVVEGNKFHDLQTDGVMVSDTKNIKILDNSFSSFYPVSDDHPDAIQFLTQGTTTSSENVLISGNIITRGDGASFQGIFMSDQVGTLAYKNVEITNNILVGVGYHGIGVFHAENVKVQSNELYSYEGKTGVSWIMIQRADGVTVIDNEALRFSYSDNTGLVEAGNIVNLAVSDGGKAALAAWTGKLELGDGTSVEAPQPAPIPEPEPQPTPIPEVPRPAPEDIVTSADHVLGAGVHNLTLTGKANLNGVGNDLDNVITGNSGSNQLFGGAGDDTISDGGAGGGNDTMFGGEGNDVYYLNIPSASEVDLVVEYANEGIDTVVVARNYELTANVENMVMTGAGGITGRGNELDNVIVGNNGANIVDGREGNDTLDGGAGDDTIQGREGDDLLTGGLGNDTFWFQKGGGHDIITDFGARGEHDSLDFSYYYRAGLTPVMTDVGDDLVISFTSGDQITLIGVHAADLTATAKGFII